MRSIHAYLMLAGLCVALPVRAHETPAHAIPQPVEPHVVAARDAALARFPARLRDRLADVPVLRQPAMIAPDDAPLIRQLMVAAAQAAYSNGTQSITVYDAGATRRPGFDRALVSPTEQAALRAMLDDLATALDAPAGDHATLWHAFARQVRTWDGDDTAIPTDAPFGNQRVLDAFVHRGVERAMGQIAPAEQLIVHEYAHALQIRDGLFFATRHMAFWGSLSGWQHADGTAFDGYASGLFMMENPIVLARLLLDGGRGESIYRPHRHARFINRYAAYDAREDFAESVRVFVYDPQTLIEVAPEKFLFINATGWCGALDASDPGPLWIDARQIIDRGWQTSLEQAARRIMWPTGDEPVVDLEVRAALLRAHADILRPEKLPPPHAASDLPDDLPKDLIDYYTADRLRPLVGGVVMHPDPQQLADEWQRALLMRLSREEWDASIFELTAGVLDQPARLHEAIAELTEMDDIELRQQQAARLLGHRVAWTTDPNAMRKATEREIAHLVDADRPLLADALRLHIADEAARAATMNGRSTDDLGAAATRAGASPDAIALHLALLEHEPNLAAADRIPGQALGMVRRTQFRFGLIEQLLAADNKEMAGVALRASLDELADSRHRHLVHALAGRARQLAVRIDDVALRQSVDALLQTGPGR